MTTVDEALNNRTFNCAKNNGQGFIVLSFELLGYTLSQTITSDTIIQVSPELLGGLLESTLVTLDDAIELGVILDGKVISHSGRTNWVGWSKIGSMDFTLDLTNDAGFRPMSWSGWVYAVKQLGKSAVVYGSNGVTLMYPAESTFGFKELCKVGVKGIGSVAGSETEHFFIDRKGYLWNVTEGGVKRLGYSELLLPMTNPQMFYDEYLNRVVISDGSTGYVLTTFGLGGGYSNVTGWEYVDGDLVTSSPGTIGHKPLHMVTDILDFGHRGMKMLEGVQIGTDTFHDLWVSCDTRYDKSGGFITTPWTRVNREGYVKLGVAGLEFRLRVKSLTLSEFDLDYFNVMFKNIDKRYIRGPMGGTNVNTVGT